MSGRVSLQDVADRAGVSLGTASRALAGAGRVSADTRTRVRDIARDLGYRPHLGARNLRMSRAGALGLYLPASASGLPFYMDVAFGLVDAAHESSTPVTLLASGQRAADVHADAFIIVDPVDSDPTVKELLADGRPTITTEDLPSVALGASPRSVRGIVSTDHEASVHGILDRMTRSGAVRTAMVAPAMDIAFSRALVGAYEHWCADTGVSPSIVYTERATTHAEIEERMRGVLRDPGGPLGLLAAPHGWALPTQRVAEQEGIVIGRDLFLAAIVDVPDLSSVNPPITAVEQRGRPLGAELARVALEVLTTPSTGIVRGTHRATVVYRGSTDPI